MCILRLPMIMGWTLAVTSQISAHDARMTSYSAGIVPAVQLLSQWRESATEKCTEEDVWCPIWSLDNFCSRWSY